MLVTRPPFLDVDRDLFRHEIGVAGVIELNHDVGLPIFDTHDVKAPSTVCGVLLYFGDRAIGDLPGKGEIIVSVGSERIAVLVDETHRQQGGLLAVTDLDFAAHFAVLVAGQFLAVADDLNPKSIAMRFMIMTSIHWVVVVAAGSEGERERYQGGVNDLSEHV